MLWLEQNPPNFLLCVPPHPKTHFPSVKNDSLEETCW